jgi:hypothetical protein
MPVTKLASAVPAPQVISSFLEMADYEVSSSVPALIAAESFTNGETAFVAKMNKNASLLDILAQCGGGMMGVKTGLTVSAGSGLQASVSVGSAVINGIVQLIAATTIALTASQDNFIWLKSDGTLEAKINTTAPATPAVFIGIATTDGSSVTAVDTSGVVYLRGIGYRETADLGAPTDTPPSGFIHTVKTLGGMFLWDGTSYKQLFTPLKTVTAVTADETEDASDRQRIVTNEGATAKPIITLETAQAGLVRGPFIVQDSDGLRIKANTGDTIRNAGNVSASAGYIENTTVGSVVTLVAINATEWIVVSAIGTWTPV